MDYAQALAQVLSARIAENRTVTARGTVTAVSADGFVTFTDAIGGSRKGVWISNPPRVGDVITYLDEGTGFPLVLGAAGRTAVLTICTSTTRPTAGLYDGMQIYETDTGRMFRYSGSVWMCFSGTFAGFITAQASTTSYVAMTGFTLPPGNWVLWAKAEYADLSSGAVNNPFLQIWDGTSSAELDKTELYLPSIAQPQRVHVGCQVTLSTTANKTVYVRCKETVSGGANRVFNVVKFTAFATASIS